MNERIKAVLLAALRLPPEERRALHVALSENLDSDADEVARLLGEDVPAEDKPGLPASDTLAKYLDT